MSRTDIKIFAIRGYVTSQFYKISYYNISVYALWTSCFSMEYEHIYTVDRVPAHHVRSVHTYAR